MLLQNIIHVFFCTISSLTFSQFIFSFISINFFSVFFFLFFIYFHLPKITSHILHCFTFYRSTHWTKWITKIKTDLFSFSFFISSSSSISLPQFLFSIYSLSGVHLLISFYLHIWYILKLLFLFTIPILITKHKINFIDCITKFTENIFCVNNGVFFLFSIFSIWNSLSHTHTHFYGFFIVKKKNTLCDNIT